MKSFLFVVCLALVQGAPSPDADADPALFYSTGYNYPQAYHHAGVHPAFVPKVVSPVVAAVHAAFPHGIVTPVVQKAVVQKVEVTPAVEVTPVTHTYASPYNFAYGAYPYAHGAYPYTTGAYPFAPLTTAASVSHDIAPGVASYVANSGGALHVVNKREADADADPALFYSTGHTYPYAASAYHHGGVHAAFPHGIATPFVNQAVVQNVEVTPTEVKTVVSPATHTYASPYNFPYTYGAYPYNTGAYPYTTGAYPYNTGAYPFTHYAASPLPTAATVSRAIAPGAPSYVANSGGAVHIVNKREADAEADAYYGGYGYGHHYGYGHRYGYGHAYGYGRRAYSGYPGYRGYSGYHF